MNYVSEIWKIFKLTFFIILRDLSNKIKLIFVSQTHLVFEILFCFIIFLDFDLGKCMENLICAKKLSQLEFKVLMNILLEFEDLDSTKWSVFINGGSVAINSQNYCKLKYLKNINLEI